jgi:glyoxylase-like metal-dependent hydrolase (beta-lactamase superfamily II)
MNDKGEATIHSDLSEIVTGIFRLSIPIPVPLKAVNAYLLKGKDGWSIVDCGFHDEVAEKHWSWAFETLGITARDVEKIVVTHYHPDHYGAAGWLQQQTGSPVLMLNREIVYLQQIWHNLQYPEMTQEFFVRHGMPELIAEGVREEHRSRYNAVSPHPIITSLEENEEVRLGNRNFQVIWTPGHTEGLMVLWDENSRVLLSNDAVLPQITPNISLNPQSRDNPLKDFFSSLEKMKKLPVEFTLPGHRGIIRNLSQRVDEIFHHHQKRLEHVYSIIQNSTEDAGLISGWNVCLSLFGCFTEAVQHKFALAETLSHIEYLVSQGKITRHDLNNRYYFSI